MRCYIEAFPLAVQLCTLELAWGDVSTNRTFIPTATECKKINWVLPKIPRWNCLRLYPRFFGPTYSGRGYRGTLIRAKKGKGIQTHFRNAPPLAFLSTEVLFRGHLYWASVWRFCRSFGAASSQKLKVNCNSMAAVLEWRNESEANAKGCN